MNELIKIETLPDGKNVVSARELHAFLEVKETFAKWIKYRIKQYDLTELVDYQFLGNFPQNPHGGRPTMEYALTLDTAKELSMVESNVKGNEARKYFLTCERNLKELQLSNVPVLPVVELAEIKEQLAKQSAELSEMKGMLEQRIIRANKPVPREGNTLSQHEKDQIAVFWDALNENKSLLVKKEHWTIDHQYLYLSLLKTLSLYEPYCVSHELEFISTFDIKNILRSGRYAPYIPSGQKGAHYSHNKAGFGRCYRFRYEVRDRELFIGDKKITFARL